MAAGNIRFAKHTESYDTTLNITYYIVGKQPESSITLLNGSPQLVNEFYTFYFGFAGFFILFFSITYVALTILKWLPFLHRSKKPV